MKKEGLPNLLKNVGELKNQAAKIGKEAFKAAETVKSAIHSGVGTSKVVAEKAGKVINKRSLATGIEATSKGAEMVAKGARFASKGVGNIASTIEKASKGMRKVSDKLKDPNKS